jgi:hypothetical protein
MPRKHTFEEKASFTMTRRHLAALDAMAERDGDSRAGCLRSIVRKTARERGLWQGDQNNGDQKGEGDDGRPDD